MQQFPFRLLHRGKGEFNGIVNPYGLWGKLLHKCRHIKIHHLHPTILHRHRCHVVPTGHGEEEGAGDADALVSILDGEILCGERFRQFRSWHEHKRWLFRLTTIFDKILNIFFVKVLGHVQLLVRFQDKCVIFPLASLLVLVYYLSSFTVVRDEIEVEGAWEGGFHGELGAELSVQGTGIGHHYRDQEKCRNSGWQLYEASVVWTFTHERFVFFIAYQVIHNKKKYLGNVSLWINFSYTPHRIIIRFETT